MKRLAPLFRAGLSPQKLALTVCIGIAFGTMPLVWGTSVICVVLAHLFRLNQLALQSVNYLLYPLQLALLLPFFRLGAWLFPGGPSVPQNMLSSLIRNPDLSSLNILLWIMLKSLAAWLVTVLPAALLIYGAVWAIILRNSRRTSGR